MLMIAKQLFHEAEE